MNPWLVAARMARASERFRVREPLPVRLVGWDGAAATPVHVRAMAHVVDVLAVRLAPVISWYESAEKERHRRTHDEMRRLYAQADATAEYADDLLERLAPAALPGIRDNLYAALEGLFTFGQYAALPGLLRDRVA